MLYDWENMTEEQKIQVVEKEMKLVTHNAITKDDLINIAHWLWDKFEIERS